MLYGSENKTGRYMTEKQKNKLLEIVRTNRWNLDKFKGAAYSAEKNRWWNKTAAILNAIPDGALKTSKQWEKTFEDMKFKLRKQRELSRISSLGAGENSSDGSQNLIDMLEVEISTVENEFFEALDRGHYSDIFPNARRYSRASRIHRIPKRNVSAKSVSQLVNGEEFLRGKQSRMERIAKAQEVMLDAQRRNSANLDKLINLVSVLVNESPCNPKVPS